MAGPSKKEIDEALEKSAKYLSAQAEPPKDVHPGPTTPSKAEIDAALAKSADYLETQGYKVTRDGYEPRPTDALPVAVVGARPSLDAAPIDATHESSSDTPPKVVEPPTDAPKK